MVLMEVILRRLGAGTWHRCMAGNDDMEVLHGGP